MGIFPDVIIEEQHNDEMAITDHPVETGAAISDHAYLMPPELSMDVGWSESAGRLNSLLGDGFLGGLIGGTPSLILVYEGLRLLQANKVFLIVSTGKRLYTNMLIKSISVTTNVESENALLVKIKFKSVNVTRTSETSLLRIEDQASPDATGPVQDGGVVTPQPVKDVSILKQISNGLGG